MTPENQLRIKKTKTLNPPTSVSATLLGRPTATVARVSPRAPLPPSSVGARVTLSTTVSSGCGAPTGGEPGVRGRMWRTRRAATRGPSASHERAWSRRTWCSGAARCVCVSWLPLPTPVPHTARPRAAPARQTALPFAARPEARRSVSAARSAARSARGCGPRSAPAGRVCTRACVCGLLCAVRSLCSSTCVVVSSFTVVSPARNGWNMGQPWGTGCQNAPGGEEGPWL
ncbi:hypothetical protein FOA52_008105 [Chlamydomonas sp. UWO 241]|nr:hypothetical protein FOA52_008105 [Chlamydomonas sp. UWO 241]